MNPIVKTFVIFSLSPCG